MPSQAEELVKAGRLDEALAALQADVRSRPADPALRVFLFQLLSVLGQWDRALNQLNVAAEMNPATLLMAQVCRAALQCEALRAEVFAGSRLPVVLGEPAKWVGWMVQAAQLDGQGQHGPAADLRARALEAAPASPGTIDGAAFEWLADADYRLGPLLEVVLDGRYAWVPLIHLQSIEFDKPSDLRDMVWTPARLGFANGGDKVALVPTRYPGSESDPDAAVRLSRRTEWNELGADGRTFAGLGQRLFATDLGEHPILETRRIVFSGAAGGPSGG